MTVSAQFGFVIVPKSFQNHLLVSRIYKILPKHRFSLSINFCNGFKTGDCSSSAFPPYGARKETFQTWESKEVAFFLPLRK